MLFTNVFDAKVINHKGELNGAPFVGPQPRDQLALVVAMGIEGFFKEFIGKEPRLQKSVHAESNEDIDCPILFSKVL